MRNANIKTDPEGTGVELGHGLDAIIGISRFDDIRIELVFGVFFPGEAFPGESDNAYFGGAEFRYTF